MQFQIVRLTDYLEIELTGQVELQSLLELIRRLGATTKANGDTHALFNLLRLEGDMHFAGQMQVGEQVARFLSHLAKVASVVAADKITRTSEKIARSQGAKLVVFDSRDKALAWLRDSEDSQPASAGGSRSKSMDAVRLAIWDAVRHLFPPHAKAIQLPNGALAISWSIANQPDAIYEMATPITVRLEPELVEHMRLASAEQRKRIATQQEGTFKAGLMGYDPFTSVPRARVIVLG